MSENYRNELALLDLKDAFKLAFQRSGKTQTTVAREMGLDDAQRPACFWPE